MSFKNFQLLVLLICAVVNVAINGQDTDINNPSAKEILDLYVSSPYVLPPGISSIAEADITSASILEKYNLTSVGSMCPKDVLYSSFHPSHARAVEMLTGYFAEQRTIVEFLNLARKAKVSEHIHPKVWYTAVSRARLVVSFDYADGQNVLGPIDLFPTTFFPAEVIQAAQKTSPKECVYLDERFGADNGIENKLWYFREDVQLNGHHWVWHLLNPWNSNITTRINRRGESFSFFHHELIARYTAERLSNGLALQKPLNLQQDTILEEGYNSHLTDGISNRTYPPRRPFRHFFESLTPSEQEVFKRVIRERDRVVDTINQGGILHENGFLEINAFDRINVLGNIAEAAYSSVNTKIYGITGFHNDGHDIISYVDAPLGATNLNVTTGSVDTGNGIRDETHGVMGSVDTTMRDILFYRWHKSIDLIFQAYKLTHLKPYTPRGGEYPLVYEGINVKSVLIVPQNDPGRLASPVNHLETFWSVRSFDLGSGLDFKDNRTLNICAKHLDHQEFEYHLNIENSFTVSKLGTVRIFLAPRFKSIQQQKRYTMQEQRPLFFTLDSFPITLPPGNHVFSRKSTDSTLTADWPKSFKEIQQEIDTGVKLRSVCDCGFPHHLLLPKGTSNGMVFDLFVMVTDGVKDQVLDNTTSQPPNYECTPSHIHCGLRGNKYPDSKPMGYPFDRRPYSKPKLLSYSPSGQHKIVNSVVENLEDYVSDIPNMHASQIVIHHRSEVREKLIHENYKYL